MRDVPTSNCEKEFVLKLIEQKKRLDEREAYDYRPMTIGFGSEYGRSHVCLGRTRVMAQVSCSVVAPKQTRPNEGLLYVNLEMSPMACPSWDAGGGRSLSVQLGRQLERCLKESKCLDVESLCIVAEEKVWQIRIDIHVLNYEGNLLDCTSVAAIAALAHFRRPDFTVDGNSLVIHKPEEKETIPLTVLHMPIAVSFALIQNGKFLLLDPSLLEEKVMDGLLVVAMNKHREICSLHVSGAVTVLREKVCLCSDIAAKKVEEITELIQSSLKLDTAMRKNKTQLKQAEFDVIFSGAGDADSSSSRRSGNRNRVKAASRTPAAEESASDEEKVEDDLATVASTAACSGRPVGIVELGKLPLKASSAAATTEITLPTKAKESAIGEGGPNTWDSLPCGTAANTLPAVVGITNQQQQQRQQQQAPMDDSDSEEEATVVLDGRSLS